MAKKNKTKKASKNTDYLSMTGPGGFVDQLVRKFTEASKKEVRW